jgi:glycerophosphoryl diester phosphodiesterase
MSVLPLLLGHRGARLSPSVPENTFASFDLALQHGCGGFEFDVRLTTAGRAVICHDAKVDRVTVSKAKAGELLHLPCLEEVLGRYAQRAFLDIELKVPGLESKVLILLREFKLENRYVISSFLPEVVAELKARNARVQVGIICDDAAQLTRFSGLDVEYVIPHYSQITQQLVQQIHRTRKKLLAWTVNDRESMLRLADWGVDGIISDDTQLLVRTFKNASN